MHLRTDASQIITASLAAVQPEKAVKRALNHLVFENGKVILVAIGKAAWSMAKAADEELSDKLSAGIIITKYNHSKGAIGSFKIFEAGHPIPNQDSLTATQCALDMVCGLTEKDTVLLLISGGGSSLFEKPLISLPDLERLTKELLASGADIQEINTIRKRFSAVKGGRFAQLCAPARVISVILSDIIGDPLDMIASGPAYPDSSTVRQAHHIVQKYQLTLTEKMKNLLMLETPKQLTNVESHVTGNVRHLCSAAAKECERLGYHPFILTSNLSCQAREAGIFLANIAQYHQGSNESVAFIAGGESVVQVKGNGLGGRNQELALAAATGISDTKNTAIFSFGSDGTDGPTDAAGGYVDQDTLTTLNGQHIDISAVLAENDSYHALQACNGLIVTGPTGTNVNDLSVVLIKR